MVTLIVGPWDLAVRFTGEVKTTHTIINVLQVKLFRTKTIAIGALRSGEHTIEVNVK